jgi:hypothetical protein
MGRLTTITVALALASVGCSTRTQIGLVPDGSPSDSAIPPSTDAVARDVPPGEQGHTCAPVTIPGDGPYTLAPGVAGTWTGYFQGGSPVSTSDAVKFALQTQADGSGDIRVFIGTGAPLPPATSATDYYPPGSPTDDTVDTPHLIEGVSYIAHGVTWEGTRLKFFLSQTEAWAGWCALQTSYFVNDSNRYNCIPGFGGSTSDDADGGTMCGTQDVQGTKQTPVPCGQFSLCAAGLFCTCDSCGCAAVAGYPGAPATVVTGNASIFDVTFEGDLATGVGAGYNVRLTRAAP